MVWYRAKTSQPVAPFKNLKDIVILHLVRDIILEVERRLLESDPSSIVFDFKKEIYDSSSIIKICYQHMK